MARIIGGFISLMSISPISNERNNQLFRGGSTLAHRYKWPKMIKNSLKMGVFNRFEKLEIFLHPMHGVPVDCRATNGPM